MLFDLTKVNLGTWRAPNCVLQIPALKENEAAGTTTHFPPLVHTLLSCFGGMWCCHCLFCKELDGSESCRAEQHVPQEQLQSMCQSSLGILQHWDRAEELMEPS